MRKLLLIGLLALFGPAFADEWPAQIPRGPDGKADLSSEEAKRAWTDLGGSRVSRGGQPLWLYNLPAIEACLDAGLDIETHGASGETILQAAVRANNLELIKALVDRGAKVTSRSRRGQTALHFAAWHGDGPMIAYLIEKGADPMARDEHGGTPIREAAQNGKLETVELLMKHGASLSSEELGRLAHSERSAAVAKALMRGGARVSGNELKRLARSGNWDMLEEALARGTPADVEYARQAIWWMGDERRKAREGGKPVDVVRYEAVLARLLKEARPDKATLDGLLMLAVEKSEPVGLKLLVAAGADPNAKTSYGYFALARAAQEGDVDTVRALIAAKADIEATDTSGRTALFTAVIHRQLEAVRALLDAGAEAKHKDGSGLTPGQLARQHGNAAVAELIAARTGDDEGQRAARIRAVIDASMVQEPGPLDAAMKAWKDVNARDDQKRVALVQAATYGYLEHAQKLLDAGANSDLLEGDCNAPRAPEAVPQPERPRAPGGRSRAPAPAQPVSDASVEETGEIDTPVPRAPGRMSARVRGSLATTDRYDSCHSALIAAVGADHLGMVKFLIARKANVNLVVGSSRRTALQEAAKVGNPAIVRAVLEAGASVVHTNANGKTALDLARESGNTKAARLIEARR